MPNNRPNPATNQCRASFSTVNEHLANIYGEGEFDQEATIRSFRIVQTEGCPLASETET